MNVRPELSTASDGAIADALEYANPMILRGLLYQATGDEHLAALELVSVPFGFLEVHALAEASDVTALRAAAAAYLRDLRDRGGQPPEARPGPALLRSLGLVAGVEIADEEAELWFEQFALDPWARGLSRPRTPPADRIGAVRVAVIGAGMGGLNAAVQLKRAGIPFTVYEKNSGVGGTWYENRYPGARVDTPSRNYTHMYALDFEVPYLFSPQAENEKYFNWMADEFDVRRHIEFDTEVRSLRWDDSAQVWQIRTAGPGGETTTAAEVVISAVGFLSRPNVPHIDGIEQFEGDAFHSARWPADLDLRGRRVGVVGSGCSGYQMVPEIAKSADHTYVFQRTPSWCFEVPGYLDPLPPQVGWLERNLPLYANFSRFLTSWIFGPESYRKVFDIDPDYVDDHARSALNHTIREDRIAYLQQKFSERPELVDQLVPQMPPLASRPVLIGERDSIYDALLRPDVTLVTSGIRAVHAESVEVGDGSKCPIDVLVFATGFRANDFLWPIEIHSREGATVEDLWAEDGARAYLGCMLPGFPNFFMLYGPNTNPAGGLTVIDVQEMEVRFILTCIAHLVADAKCTVEVSEDGYRRYNREIDQAESLKIYSDPRVTNYFQNSHGRSAGNCPLDARRLWRLLRDPDGPRLTDDPVQPYFGADLIVG